MITQEITSRLGATLNVATLGDGPPILLLHGVLRNPDDFADIIPSLANDWRVLAPAFRGHALSQRLPGRYRVSDYVEDAVATLLDAAESPAVIVGHSLGAMVAAGVAAKLPNRVRGIVLEDPPMQTMGTRIGETALLGYFQQLKALVEEPHTATSLAEALADIQLVTPGSTTVTRLGETRDQANLLFFAKCLLQTDPQVLDPIVAGSWLSEYDAEQVFRQIECPVLLLQGNITLGGMLTDVDADAIESWCRYCTRIRFPDLGHHIHSTRPAAMLRHIQQFVETLPEVASGHEIPSPHLRTVSHEDGTRHNSHPQRTTR